MSEQTIHTFHKGRTELLAFKSKAVPGTIAILVIGPTKKTVQDTIDQIRDHSTGSSFMAPIQCPDRLWNAVGRITQ